MAMSELSEDNLGTREISSMIYRARSGNNLSISTKTALVITLIFRVIGYRVKFLLLFDLDVVNGKLSPLVMCL